MKTFLALFAPERITDENHISSAKKYSFNTEAEVKPGNLFKTKSYNKYLQVTEVLEEPFEFVMIPGGEVTNTKAPNTVSIKVLNDLEIVEE